MDKIRETKRELRLKAWGEMYRQYKESGRTVSEWCKEQGISPKTFYYRLRKIREAALAVKEKHEIVPVQQPVITAKQPEQNSQESIKISANGIVAELPQNISSELIAAVIRGLREC